MRSLDDLLDEATLGKLTKEEIQYVVSRIKEYDPSSNQDLYGLLCTLGRAITSTPMIPQYRKLMESFLVYPTDSMISRIAFIVLCDYWGLTNEYLQQMKDFIRGVDWDDNDVRLVAISTAGEHLRENFNPELLELLIETFEGSGCSSKEELYEEEVVRQAAYSALARADNWEWEDLPPVNVNLIRLLEKGQIDLSVVNHAKARLL